jgi:thioredoxin-related protein
MKRITMGLLVLTLGSGAQSQGVNFVEAANWQDILQQAKQQHKFIFVDAYTTWCVPCQFMAAMVFPNKDLGDFVNAHFISVSIQMDSTQKDNPFVRSWYQQAHDFLARYNVEQFPTYLFFDADGRIVHKAIGASGDPNSFQAKASAALQPETQFYTLMDRYGHGERDSLLLRTLFTQAKALEDDSLAMAMGRQYRSGNMNPYDPNNLELLGRMKIAPRDPEFQFWYQHIARIDSVIGKDYAERKIANAIADFDPLIGSIMKDTSLAPDWPSVRRHLQASYTDYFADRITQWTMLNFYRAKKDWHRYVDVLTKYMIQYRATVTKGQYINGYAWDVFLYSQDTAQLRAALTWVQPILTSDDGLTGYYYDTYANLLYKLDRSDTRAIEAEKKAVPLTPSVDRKNIEKNLEKMQKGLPTWN